MAARKSRGGWDEDKGGGGGGGGGGRERDRAEDGTRSGEFSSLTARLRGARRDYEEAPCLNGHRKELERVGTR